MCVYIVCLLLIIINIYLKVTQLKNCVSICGAMDRMRYMSFVCMYDCTAAYTHSYLCLRSHNAFKSISNGSNTYHVKHNELKSNRFKNLFFLVVGLNQFEGFKLSHGCYI